MPISYLTCITQLNRHSWIRNSCFCHMHRYAKCSAGNKENEKFTRAIQSTPPEFLVDKVRSQLLLDCARFLPMYMGPL